MYWTTTRLSSVLFLSFFLCSFEKMYDDIEFMAFSAGGMNGATYFGVLQALQEDSVWQEKLKQIKGVAGTSIGCMIALAIVLEMNYSTLMEILLPTFSNFSNVVPLLDISSLISNYGFDTGEHLKKAIRTVLNANGLSEHITFKHLYQYYPKELVCVATDMKESSATYFSVKSHPDMLIVDAMFMSMCVPFLFTPVKYNDRLYVDGVLVMHIPMCFEAQKTLCIYLENGADQNLDNWTTYLQRLFVCTSSAQYDRFKKYESKKIIIKTSSVAIDLHVNNSKIATLKKKGYIAVLHYLHEHFTATIEMVLGVFVDCHVQTYSHEVV
jgi:hypothetical protein